MADYLKAHGYEWQDDLLVFTAELPDGSPIRVAAPGHAVAAAFTQQPNAPSAQYEQTTVFPVEAFRAGSMPIEAKPLVALMIETPALPAPLWFSCSIEQAEFLSDLLGEETAKLRAEKMAQA